MKSIAAHPTSLYLYIWGYDYTAYNVQQVKTLQSDSVRLDEIKLHLDRRRGLAAILLGRTTSPTLSLLDYVTAFDVAFLNWMASERISF